jgi:hypothetical protein
MTSGLAPGINAGGLNQAAAPTTCGVIDVSFKSTGLEIAPLEDEKLSVKVAVCPAVIEVLGTVRLSESSSTIKLTAGETPPPAGGFSTVMFSVPPWAMSEGSNVTWSSVELM